MNWQKLLEAAQEARKQGAGNAGALMAEAMKAVRAAAVSGDTNAQGVLESDAGDNYSGTRENVTRLPMTYKPAAGSVGSLTVAGARSGMAPVASLPAAMPLADAGVPGFDPSSIIGDYAGAQASSNRANESRYNQILAELSGMGRSQSMRIGRTARQSKAELEQTLRNRGLGNATVIGPMLQRVDENTNLHVSTWLTPCASSGRV